VNRHAGLGAHKARDRGYWSPSVAKIEDRSNTRIGPSHWAKEGIAGRGVLIDNASWAERQGIPYSTFSTYEIKLADTKTIGKEYNIEFQKGNILTVRIGMTQEWDNNMTLQQKQPYASNPSPHHVGIEAT
jgi:hypothetical protein